MQLRFSRPQPDAYRRSNARWSANCKSGDRPWQGRYATTYRLCFGEDGLGPEHTIEFDAHSPGAALALLERDRRGRRVTLWEGERCLCVLRRSCGLYPIWIVTPCPETSAPTPGPRPRA